MHAGPLMGKKQEEEKKKKRTKCLYIATTVTLCLEFPEISGRPKRLTFDFIKCRSTGLNFKEHPFPPDGPNTSVNANLPCKVNYRVIKDTLAPRR